MERREVLSLGALTALAGAISPILAPTAQAAQAGAAHEDLGIVTWARG